MAGFPVAAVAALAAILLHPQTARAQIPESLGFRVWGLGFRVWGSGFGVQGLEFRVEGSGFGVQGLGFGI